MGAKENADLVRRGYEAFSAGDMATLTELFAEDATWFVPGNGSLSGTKQGRDAIFGFFGEVMSLSGGTFKITVQDVVGGDQHTIGLHHTQAQRGGKDIDQNTALVFHVENGRVREVREFHENTANSDEFWA